MTRASLEAAVIAAARDWYASSANREAALAGAVQALERHLRAAPPTYSPFIDAIACRLEARGVTVTVNPDLPVAGRYHRDQRLVELRGALPARAALLAIAHEAGHHEGYERFPGPETPAGQCSRRRELEAYVYGWHVLREVQAPITRAEWLAECRAAEGVSQWC